MTGFLIKGIGQSKVRKTSNMEFEPLYPIGTKVTIEKGNASGIEIYSVVCKGSVISSFLNIQGVSEYVKIDDE
jgi:hypothetical protein